MTMLIGRTLEVIVQWILMYLSVCMCVGICVSVCVYVCVILDIFMANTLQNVAVSKTCILINPRA